VQGQKEFFSKKTKILPLVAQRGIKIYYLLLCGDFVVNPSLGD
jgi:hypothetical protein